MNSTITSNRNDNNNHDTNGIIIFTSCCNDDDDDNDNSTNNTIRRETIQLRTLLMNAGCPYTEKVITNEQYNDLRNEFDGTRNNDNDDTLTNNKEQIVLPCIVMDDRWVPYHCPNLLQLTQEYVTNLVLNTIDENDDTSTIVSVVSSVVLPPQVSNLMKSKEDTIHNDSEECIHFLAESSEMEESMLRSFNNISNNDNSFVNAIDFCDIGDNNNRNSQCDNEMAVLSSMPPLMTTTPTRSNSETLSQNKNRTALLSTSPQTVTTYTCSISAASSESLSIVNRSCISKSNKNCNDNDNNNEIVPNLETDKNHDNHSGNSSCNKMNTVRLPNGEAVGVGQMIHRLLPLMKHKCTIIQSQDTTTKKKNANKYHYSITGDEVIRILQKYFVTNTTANAATIHSDDAVKLGYTFIDAGVLYCYNHRNSNGTTVSLPNRDCDTFRQLHLVLQPFRHPEILNEFVVWNQNPTSTSPSGQNRGNDNIAFMNVVIHLSCLMDQIIDSMDDDVNRGNNNNTMVMKMETSLLHPHCYHQYSPTTVSLLEKFEIEVCQLQVLSYRNNPNTTTATNNNSNIIQVIEINLLNTMIRHAMIVCNNMYRNLNKMWSWPCNLNEVNIFFHMIGYNIGGTYTTILQLQQNVLSSVTPSNILMERNKIIPSSATMHIENNNKNKSAAKNNSNMATKWWKLFSSCRGSGCNKYDSAVIDTSTAAHCNIGPAKSNEANKAMYLNHSNMGKIHWDHRILMSITWGTKSSPHVGTIYPNQYYDSMLQKNAESYCQSTIVIGTIDDDDIIILPTHLSWFRYAFGNQDGTAVSVLECIRHYLSVEQQMQIDIIKYTNNGCLNVVFDNDLQYNWSCGLSVLPKVSHDYPSIRINGVITNGRTPSVDSDQDLASLYTSNTTATNTKRMTRDLLNFVHQPPVFQRQGRPADRQMEDCEDDDGDTINYYYGSPHRRSNSRRSLLSSSVGSSFSSLANYSRRNSCGNTSYGGSPGGGRRGRRSSINTLHQQQCHEQRLLRRASLGLLPIQCSPTNFAVRQVSDGESQITSMPMRQQQLRRLSQQYQLREQELNTTTELFDTNLTSMYDDILNSNSDMNYDDYFTNYDDDYDFSVTDLSEMTYGSEFNATKINRCPSPIRSRFQQSATELKESNLQQQAGMPEQPQQQQQERALLTAQNQQYGELLVL